MTAVDASVESQSGYTVLAESTFDTNADGWGIINDGSAPTHYATGGESGGFIQSKDKGSGTYWYWKAPAEFLGNKSAAYGGELTFYLRQQSAMQDQREKDDILLAGGGYTLVYTLYPSPGYPSAGWTSYIIPLVETTSNWKNKTTGLAPTQAQMQAVLANLLSIKIRGEYEYGADTGEIDSVYLKSALFTPTPTLTSTPTATATFTPTYTPIPTNTPVPGPTATSGCYGSGCEGFYPEAMNCSNGNTGAKFKSLFENGVYIGEVVNKYSPDCDAQWEVTYNYSGSYRFAEGSIRHGNENYSLGIQSVPLLRSVQINLGYDPEHLQYSYISSGGELSKVYTRMYGNGGAARSCGALASDTLAPPADGILPPEQPVASQIYIDNNCIEWQWIFQ